MKLLQLESFANISNVNKNQLCESPLMERWKGAFRAEIFAFLLFLCSYRCVHLRVWVCLCLHLKVLLCLHMWACVFVCFWVSLWWRLVRRRMNVLWLTYDRLRCCSVAVRECLNVKIRISFPLLLFFFVYYYCSGTEHSWTLDSIPVFWVTRTHLRAEFGLVINPEQPGEMWLQGEGESVFLI